MAIYDQIKEQYTKAQGTPSNSNLDDLKELKRLLIQDPGYVNEPDLEKMKETIRQERVPEHRFKIAVMHHNPVSVPTQEIDQFEVIINSGSLAMALTECGFDLVLHGHRHLSHCTNQRLLTHRSATAQGLFVIGAASWAVPPRRRLWKSNSGTPKVLT